MPAMVLFLDAVFLRVDIPARFNTFTSLVLSPVTTVLVVEDVSRKEQNEAEEMKTPEEVKTVEKSLIIHSLFNLTLFTCYTVAISLMIGYNLLKPDIHNTLDIYNIGDFMFIISFEIFLPLVGLNILSCLLMFFLPASSSKGSVRTLNRVLSLIIFSGTIAATIGFFVVVANIDIY